MLKLLHFTYLDCPNLSLDKACSVHPQCSLLERGHPGDIKKLLASLYPNLACFDAV